jgi:amino acid adenylation domain-containing protein
MSWHQVPPIAGEISTALSLAEKRALAERLLQKRASTNVAEYPQSYSQRAMWFLHRLDPQSPAYHVGFAVRIRSAVDGSALADALQHLVIRHSALRTTFADSDCGPIQIVAGYAPAPFTEVAASGWSEEDLQCAVRNAYAQPFDLERGPAVRVTLFNRAEDDHLLLIVAHHIVIDGWSFALFLQELLAIYHAERTGVPAALPAPAARYADYVAWQRQQLAGPEGARLWAFWQQELAGALPVLALPADFPRPPVQNHAGATEVFDLGSDLTARLRGLARAEGVTLYVLLLAAFHVLLAGLAAQEETLIGSPMAGRSRPEFAGIVGDFINMVVLRVRSRPQQTFRDLLGQVRHTVLVALDHQEFPFALLVERLLGSGRDPSRSPIFQVSFDLQRLQRFGALAPLFLAYHPDARLVVDGMTLEPFYFPQQEGQFDLGLQLAEAEDTIVGGFKYSTALFAAATVHRMLGLYQSLLEKIVAEPHTTTGALLREFGTLDLNAFLTHLRQQDIKLWVDGDKLRVNAPAGSLTPVLQKEIAQRKDALVAVLKQAPGVSESAPALKPIRRNGPLRLSFSQQRLWFLDQMTPGSAAYNIPMAVTIDGPLHLSALQRSLDEVVRRHEVLRTHFVAVDGQAAQVIDSPQSLAMPIVDLAYLEEEARMAEAHRLVLAEAQRPFVLSEGPLLRSLLVCLDPQRHLLVLTVHHIAADAWSLGILTRELGALYQACAGGQDSPLAPLPFQYADFADWQREWAQGERMQRELAYWMQQLKGPLPLLDLPTDYPRPPVLSTRGTRREFSLPRAVLDDLNAFCRREGVTLYMALLAVFKTLLYRYTRQEDIIIGSPVAGRHLAETEGLIGFFVNNLVLRTNLSGDPTFREVLARVRQVTLTAYDNQHVPFDRLVETLQPERDLSRLPFFQVLFNLHNAAIEELKLENVKMERYKFETTTSRYDLTLELWERPEGLLIDVEYCTELFAEATIQRMLGHFAVLLTGAIAEPDSKIAALPLLTPAERRQLLDEWNDTRADYPQALPVHRLFEAHAAAAPFAPAVSCMGKGVQYGELNARANRLARHLQALGVTQGTLVGIFMERSIEMVVALLAVHKAGGAYLPLDPAFPRDRLAYMLEDSQTGFLIAQGRLAAELPPHAAEVVFIDHDWPEIARCGAENLEDSTAYDPARLAYLLYTSGSTGRPKGVEIPQRALVNFLVSMQRMPGLARTDKLLSVTTLSFDIAGLEIFLPLVTGAALEIVSHAVAADGAALLAALQSCGATVMQATPATWRLLIGAGWQGTPGLKILCGGEAMPGELAGQLLGRAASLWNMYGPTETTIWSTVYRVTTAEGIMPIGRPIANTQVYVLDASGQPVPVGIAGELYIGGDGVAHGYLNRPELTEEKFVANPFAGDSGARMYRTGDLVRYRGDGNLDFLGRIDFQVKVRGFRIELGEIEAVLDEHPAIRQAVVMAREDTPGDRRLVGYLVLAGTATPAAAELRTYLKEKLPDYMVPGVFVPLDSFPLTPNGKVNRKALPPPAATRVETSAHYVAPRTNVERQVAAIWQAVLGVEKVGVTDNFFDLGGHSLLIVQVHNQIRRLFTTDLSIAQMFQFPTVEALASYLQQPPANGSSLQSAQARAQRMRAELEQPVRSGR